MVRQRHTDLNTAPVEQLMLLRGVGGVRATRIMSARPFTDPYQLVMRNIIPEAIDNRIETDLIVSPPAKAPQRPQSAAASASCAALSSR